MVATAERNGHTRIPPQPPPHAKAPPRPGRTANGRFAPGNPGGPGNPYARKSARHRSVICDGLCDQDVLDLTHTLLHHAKQGNMTAARLLLQYAIGKPGEAKDPDRLDDDEWAILKERQNHSLTEMNDTLEGFPLSVLLGMTKGLVQLLEDTLHDKFIALGQKPDGAVPAAPVPPKPRTPSSGPSPVRNEDSMGGIRGMKTPQESCPDQPPTRCVTSPIETGEVGDVGTTCPSSQDPNDDPDSELDVGEFPGGLTEEEVLAEFGMSGSIDQGKRFRRILGSLHTIHGLPVPGVAPEPPSEDPPVKVSAPIQEAPKPSPDQRPGACVTAPIESGEVGAVGTTCPSSQEPDSQGNSTLDKGKMEEDLNPEDLFTAFGIPAHVLEDARFQKLLEDIQSHYGVLTQEDTQQPGAPSGEPETSEGTSLS